MNLKNGRTRALLLTMNLRFDSALPLVNHSLLEILAH